MPTLNDFLAYLHTCYPNSEASCLSVLENAFPDSLADDQPDPSAALADLQANRAEAARQHREAEGLGFVG